MKDKKKKGEKVGFWADFKKFITKGNVLDLAVAVVISTAFNAIVNGLVKNIIMPFVSHLTSGKSVDEWEYVLQSEVDAVTGEVVVLNSIKYGLWIQSIIDFIIIAFSVFVLVRLIKSAERKLKAKELAAAEAEAAQKKAEADAAAAAEAAAQQAAADAQKAREEEYMNNVREQSQLLRDILNSVKK